jgi:hypothetical protein
MPVHSPDTTCPLCGEANLCRSASGQPYKGACWCEEFTLPVHFLRYLEEGALAPACFCRACFTELDRLARSVDAPEDILQQAQAIRRPNEPDFYLDELGRTVFTTSYHLKRGYCCDSGCRHCPYPATA